METKTLVSYAGYDPKSETCLFRTEKQWAHDFPPIPAARLISQAPALLEALEAARDALLPSALNSQRSRAYAAVVHAIEQARG